MQKIKIEKLTLNDIREVAELGKNSLPESWSEKNYTESLENPNYHILVAKLNNKIVGFISMYCASGEGYICNIAVKKNHRECGIGTSLIAETIKYSKNKNLKFLTLEVRESNVGAIKFYEKMEFVKIGTRKNFYSNPTENAVIMTLYFKEGGQNTN